MNKTLKEKLIKHHEEVKTAFPNLYDQKWMEKAADEGWKDLVGNLEKTSPKLAECAKMKEGYNIFAVIYYSSFEAAMNTFFHQIMEDAITEIQVTLDKLQNMTAEIKTKI